MANGASTCGQPRAGEHVRVHVPVRVWEALSLRKHTGDVREQMVEGEQGTRDSEAPAPELSHRREGRPHPAQRALGLHPCEPREECAPCPVQCLLPQLHARRAAPSRALASPGFPGTGHCAFPLPEAGV